MKPKTSLKRIPQVLKRVLKWGSELIHKHGEGELIRSGIGFCVLEKGKFYGITLAIGRRFWVVLDWEMWQIRGMIDRTHDHLMYRPNDQDTPSLVCRRCGETSGGRFYTHEGPRGQCSGSWTRWELGRKVREIKTFHVREGV